MGEEKEGGERDKMENKYKENDKNEENRYNLITI
jgi:hypothetical protein